MVVAYHTLQAAYGESLIQTWPNLSAGVDLFFIISGFVMVTSTRRLAARPGAWRIFLQRRAMRLVPLYWLLTCAKYAVAVLEPGLTPHTRPDLANFLASLAFIPARDAAGQIRPVLPVGWSLNFEVFFYLLFAAALAWRLRPVWLVAPLGIVAVAGFFRAPDWPAPLFLANPMVLEFAGGMLVWYAITRGWRPPTRWAVVMAAGAFAVLLALPLAGPLRCLVWGAPAAAIVAIAVAMEPRWGKRLPASVLRIGDASYAIYLVHPFVVPALAVHGWVGMLGWMGMLGCVPASIAAGLAVHFGIDMPLQQNSRRWAVSVA
jgi:peptidoglycan/LPS O-acetylase OafA/YrhL